MPATTTIYLRIPPPLADWLDREAIRRNISRNRLVCDIIERAELAQLLNKIKEAPCTR